MSYKNPGELYSVPRHCRGPSCFGIYWLLQKILFSLRTLRECIWPLIALCLSRGPGLFMGSGNSVVKAWVSRYTLSPAIAQGCCQGKGVGPFYSQTQQPCSHHSQSVTLKVFLSPPFLHPYKHSLLERGLLSRNFCFLLCKRKLEARKKIMIWRE